ncbi:MAG: dTDP-4-amino-4,6-dideoxygalactose transaminase [Sodalis sp. Ffu]|nr:MAG: dTDP-4-amino-4,6-dideoxygalactose transaminase [Sodalis sp. Ffu]
MVGNINRQSTGAAALPNRHMIGCVENCGNVTKYCPKDEVIMPSNTFSHSNIVFVDIHPNILNIDKILIKTAMTSKTSVIVPIHYTDVAFKMETIITIAQQYQLW